MDSITQALLGAAVGEAVLGQKVGNKAVLWGAIAGTIPDLDVFLDFFLTDLQSLLVHRGFSHSILFAIIMAPVLGWLALKIYPHGQAGFKDWTKLFFWAMVTHPLLDIFTSYGTQLFLPFSSYRIEFNTISIIDPIFTIPLLVAVISVLFINRNARARKYVIPIALSISGIYLALTCVNKLHIHSLVQESLHSQQIDHVDFITIPTLFNNFLWSVIVKQDSQFLVGYYSLFDQGHHINFKAIPQNQHLLLPFQDKNKLGKLTNFTKGYYALESENNGIILNDLRFGTTSGWFDLSKPYIFSFKITPLEYGLHIEKLEPEIERSLEAFNQLFERMKGE